MELPIETQNLIDQSLQIIRSNPQHDLEPKYRFAIYKSFGTTGIDKIWDDQKFITKLVPTIGSRAISWLAILTASHVLPIWEQAPKLSSKLSNYYFQLPQKFIEAAYSVMKGTLDVDVVISEYCNDFEYYTTRLQSMTLENVYCAMNSAYYALTITLYGSGDIRRKSDFASIAMLAYATKDENEPGKWRDAAIIRKHLDENAYLESDRASTKVSEFLASADAGSVKDIFEMYFDERGLTAQERKNQLESYKPLKYDSQKALEFWKWWLTEAIPQAWELAQQSASNQE